MTEITLILIEEVYVLGKRIVEGTLDKKDAILSLAELGMNEKSAKMYLCIAI